MCPSAEQQLTERVLELTLEGEITDPLGEEAVQSLTTYAVAGANGLFVQREISGETVDLVLPFEFHAQMVDEAAAHMAARNRT
ncbi:hypothetical protein [Streptomyces sp. SID13726]|uniref:hypothetical protein n=1 Tax=Streptomyces sp. SID13726 TaxID=2706058 RepID=UPI0013B83C68|nr:hypothetical protein [Streptomyces sp. SID13726]NEB03465.1 hypothetical protein [Streptomyces sp. SID13726]